MKGIFGNCVAMLVAMMSWSACFAYYTPTVFPDSTLAGINIQKSITKMMNGDSIRIMYFGQSIVSRVATGTFINWWPDSVTRSLRARYPNAKIKDTNAAISGCDATCIRDSNYVVRKLVPWHPDLLIFYDYAHLETQMETNIRQMVTQLPSTDIVVFDYHWSQPKDNHWTPAGQLSEVPWEDALSWDYLPFLCEKYKIGYLDIRTPWVAYQNRFFPGRAGQDSLTNPADGIHLTNTNGNYLMWQLVRTYFVPQVTSTIPSIDSASALGSKVWLHFNEKVDSISARTVANYSIDSGSASIAGLTLNPDFRTVTLYTASPLADGPHIVTVTAVKDRAGNSLPANTKKSLTVSTPATWSNLDIGRVYLPGATAVNSATGVLTLHACGEHASPMQCAWGAPMPNPCYPYWMWRNEFQYAWRTLTGNFTLTAQVSNVDSLLWKGQAGIMIREDLLYLSKFVAINTLEDSSSARFDFVSRTSLTDTIVTVKPRSTVSSAALWLRLTRSDSTIQAYTSTDGSTWTFQGATTAPMTAQITAGLFVCGNEYSAGTFMAGFSNVSFTGTSAADNPFVLPVASHPFAQLTRNELRVSNMAPGRQKLLRLTDAGGRTVWSDRTSDTRYSAPLPRLSHGIYIFSIIGPGTNWSGPLIR